ncbi:cation:proton antiporter [Nocardia sp. NPDC004604]|uniref:cation:proton antiporter n=1 Tax=Nocardia sp. NPDC004604 TaxID=3157013 RepID=UPI0033BC7A88
MTTTTIPMIPGRSLLILLLQLATLLLLARVLGRLAERLSMPRIVGELLSGVLLGPSIAGWVAPGFTHWLFPPQVEQTHLLDAIGQVGLLMLVCLTGMEMDFGLIRRRGRAAVSVSLAGILVPLTAGIGVGLAISGTLKPDGISDGVFALFLGVALCVTAIPVIGKTLMDMNLTHRNVGQLTLAAGVVDDAFGWFMLSVVSATAAGSLTIGNVLVAIVNPLLFVGVAVLLGRPLVRFILARTGSNNGQSLGTIVLLILVSSAAAQALKLEAIFGAFICGAVISSCGAFERGKIASLRPLVLAFLAPVYFATAGLRMNLRELNSAAVIGIALLILVAAIAGKFIGAYIGARISRLNQWEALALGAGMNARGIVEVVVATVGLQIGVIRNDTYTIIILVAVVTSIMAPPILRLTMRRIEQTSEEELRLAEYRSPPVGAVADGKA